MPFHGYRLRLGRVSQSNRIYSITSVTYQRQPLFNEFNSARILIHAMAKSDSEQQCSTLAFVVMPDHFHWLVQLHSNLELKDLIGQVKRRTSYQLHQQAIAKDKVWQHGYYDHNLRHEDEILPTCRYIVANPLRAKLVTSVKDYPHWDCCYL
ncbi:transposase [Motilimonas sp. 1_MG-2023]|nr:transposase [Motilimonas sp. E26]MDO6524226.1 transposase [Motilimonas sp. 1_MG-2023]